MKKIVSLLLVLVLALGMSTMVFAADRKADTVYFLNDFDTNEWTPQKGPDHGTWTYPAGVDKGGDPWKIEIPFAWVDKDGNVYGDADVLSENTVVKATSGIGSKSEASNAKITFKTSLRSGSKVFDNISITSRKGNSRNQAMIELKMQEYFVSTGDTDFEIRIIAYIGGSRTSDEIVVSGNYRNEKYDDIDADSDWVDMSEGYVAEATEYNKLLEADLGEGVSVWTKMFKDKKYYGVAIRDDDEKDDTVYTKYPDIDSIITMKTVGLSSTAQYVTFQDFDDTFYVYGADFKYLGKSNEKVAFSSKYYLANKMLDVDEEGDEEPYDDEEYDDEIPEAGPITGGDGYPENVNDNPGTGK